MPLRQTGSKRRLRLAADPDFSTIDDPLNLEYALFRADDLLIARSNPLNNETQSQVDNYILETENRHISSQHILNVNVPPCWLTSGRQPQQTRAGRFFDLGYDVIVTLTPTTNASGGDCAAPGSEDNMSLHIQDIKTGVNTPTAFKMSAASTALAMDDFSIWTALTISSS